MGRQPRTGSARARAQDDVDSRRRLGVLIGIGLTVLAVGSVGLLIHEGEPSALGTPVTGDIALRDPYIVPDDDEYYLFSTGQGIPVRRSLDGREWEEIGVVFPDGLPGWTENIAPGVTAPWAPSLAYFEDRWHLYYAVSTFGTWTSGIGLATNPTLNPDDPAYEWTDQGIVVRSEHADTQAKLRRGADGAWNAIDPWIARDGNDEPWLAWGSFAGGIYLRRIDPATGLLDPDAPVHHLAQRPNGIDGIEAANLVERDGMWYLFSSWDFCCRGVQSTYNVRVGRAAGITEPYADQQERPLLDGGGSLVLGAHGRVIGPGHTSVIQEGDRWFLAHHFYDADADGRATLDIRPLLWTSDGWPVAADPGFVPAGFEVTAETATGSWVVTGYENENPEIAHAMVRLDLDEDGSVGENAGTWTFEDGVVRITARPHCAEPERSYELFVDDQALQMHGRTGDGAALRALRTEPPDDGAPSPAC